MPSHHVPAVSRTTHSTCPPLMIPHLHLTCHRCPRGFLPYVLTLEWCQVLHTNSPRRRECFLMVPPGLSPRACILSMIVIRIQPGRILAPVSLPPGQRVPYGAHGMEFLKLDLLTMRCTQTTSFSRPEQFAASAVRPPGVSTGKAPLHTASWWKKAGTKVSIVGEEPGVQTVLATGVDA